MLWTMSSMASFKVWSGQNLNLSEILCMSWLPADPINNECASLEKSFSHRSIMNVLVWRNHFSHYSLGEKFFQWSKVCNSEVNDPIRLEFEPIWDFMPVLDTCKFGEDLI